MLYHVTHSRLGWAFGLALLLAGCLGKNQSSEVASADAQPCPTQGLALTATPLAYDAVFPIEISHFVAGTRVLQPKTGHIYRCKASPYAGFCQQWSASNTMFEPGIGSNWMAAWDLQ